MKTLLYIHGMGGGEDSRIPNLLKDLLPEFDVIVRTNDFDPEKARAQIGTWCRELNPEIVVGESMGANYALLFAGRGPLVLVSPALNGPWRFGTFSFLAAIPGVQCLLHRIFPWRGGGRQKFDFTPGTLRHFSALFRDVKQSVAERTNAGLPTYAFFGTRDSYRLSGVVSLSRWRREFGKGSFELYRGSHHMPEEELHRIVRKVREFC